ncbi:MAG: ankyrin repeat domain-containing protein [Tatlockia sp.]|nr:ankyrin repeat domain-containing protein [Tatlockia sp.]
MLNSMILLYFGHNGLFAIMMLNLPIEILLEIFSYLSPETISSIRSVHSDIKKTAEMGREWGIDSKINLFWLNKLKQHFPQTLKTLKLENNINYYAEFRIVYEFNYRKLSIPIRKLFSLIKENDLESLKETPITLEMLASKDYYGTDLLLLAQKINNQAVLDYLYQAAQKYYARDKYDIDPKKMDSENRTILYWAIALHQNVEQISLLLEVGSTLSEEYTPAKWRPIHIAAQGGKLDLFEAFLNSDPESLEITDVWGQTSLLWAAANGHLSVVNYLIGKKANLNVASNCTNSSVHGYTPLFWATKSGYCEVVKSLIKAGAIITTVIDNNLYHPIHIAATLGRLNLIKAFIDNDFESLEQKDNEGQTPLLLAVKNGHLKVVDFLLSKGAATNVASINADITDPFKTPLYWAIKGGHYQIVNSLLKAGAISKAVGAPLNYQPIHIAAKKGRLNIVKALIEDDLALLDDVDLDGQTPLLWAAYMGHLDVLNYLISKGARLNLATNNPSDKGHGKTPLYWATERGHSLIVDSLMKAGAATTALGPMKYQPIHIAAQIGRLDVVKALIENDPELLEQEDAKGNTPLLLAVLKGNAVLQGNLEVVDYLISKGAKIDVVAIDNKTALYWATECGHYRIVKSLLKAGALTKVASGDLKYLPIHIAAKNGRLDLVKALIEQDPEYLDQVDGCGQTPLLWSAVEGQSEVVDYLISKGAELNLALNLPTDKNHGKTPLYLATERGHCKVIDSLMKAGAVATTAVGPMQYQPVHIAVKAGQLDIIEVLLKNHPQLIEEEDAFGQTPLQLAASCGNNEIVEALLKAGAKPDSSKPIHKSNLNEKTRGKIELLEYIPKRSSQPMYKTSYTLFCCFTFNFGNSRDEKLKAARALAAVKIHGADKKILDKFKEELNNGELKTIYQKL